MQTARSTIQSSLRSLSVALGVIASFAPAALAQHPTPRPAPPALLAQFDANVGTVQLLTPLAGANGDYAVPIMLGGLPRTMALQPYEMRSPTFRLIVEDATGRHQVPTPPCTTYRGFLLEDPQTEIAASIIDGSVSAILHQPAGLAGPAQSWVVQPVREVNPAVGASTHFVYLASDTVPLPYTCGNGVAVPRPGQQAPIGLDTVYECDIAIEADLEFYQLNGSNVTATQNDVTSVMNQVEFIYNRDCDIQYDLTTIIVSTTAVYSSNDANILLSQFASRWNSVHAAVPRDVAHLFTGRNLLGTTIGLAQLSSICNLGVAYGLSQSRFSTNFSARVGLTSHELGHGWSAQHCDASSPCYIMCSGLGGCSANVTLFGPSEISQITAFAPTCPCLNTIPIPPQITAATPNPVSVFNPGVVVLTGQGFTGVSSYRVGTTNFSSGFGVTNDYQMSITMPTGTALGVTQISVTNPQGISNSFPMVYNVTSPPKLKATGAVPATGGIASFDFGGTPNRMWFLLLGITNTTVPLQGFPLLDPHLILTTGTFPAPLGITNVSVPVPPGIGLLIFYLQVLEALPSAPVATGTTNITVTVLL